MKVLVYVWILMIILFSLCMLFGIIVEKHVPETHPFKKWWRRNIIDRHPNEK